MATEAVNEEPTRRVRLLVAYDGTGFAGFAVNEGVRTVAGDLTAALNRVLRHDVRITAAGRTDRGVHGWGQVVTFSTDATHVEPGRLARSVTALCGPEIVVRAAEFAPPGFDARFSATARSYRYTIHRGRVLDPFRDAYEWHLPRALDIEAMNRAATTLLGEHDFSSFCRRPGPLPDGTPRSLVRDLRVARWSERPDGRLRFEIEAGSFCHQMVRSVVGTLVEVGLGRRDEASVAVARDRRDRAAVTTVAPPKGLCLWSVSYGEAAPFAEVVPHR